MVYKKTPAFAAIKSHIKLFNIVRSEYDEESTINREGSFSTYYLNNRWDYVNMARECVRNKNILYSCNITPLRKGSAVDGGPFWFKIEQTRSDGYKLSPEEICDLFWKKINREGFSLYILGMDFHEITTNINSCIQESKEHAVPMKVTLGDVVMSCKKINKDKSRSWYGYPCLLALDTGKFKKSVVNISRPNTEGRSRKGSVATTPAKGIYPVTTIKPLVVRTMGFKERSLPVTANFK